MKKLGKFQSSGDTLGITVEAHTLQSSEISEALLQCNN